MMSEHALAGEHIDRAIALAPNDVEVMRAAGVVKGYQGDHEGARNWFEKVKMLDPQHGDGLRELLFDNLYMSGRYQEAVNVFCWMAITPVAHVR